jgi:hypothetical protein
MWIMDRDEFESRYGEKKYATIIFVPHARAKFRKLVLSHRLIFAMLALAATSFGLSSFFTFMYMSELRDEAYSSRAATESLERELTNANTQVAASFHHLDLLTRKLIREQRQREQQLRELNEKYQTLRALAAGQESIAEAHRAILQRRTLTERLFEMGIGFVVGVLSSIVATAIWGVRTAVTVSAAEVTKIEEDTKK